MSHLSEHFKQRRLKKKLRLADLAKAVGYRNVVRGIRRIDTFEQTGVAHSDLLAKLAAALDVDRTTVTRLAYEDYRDWFAAVSKPGTPCVISRIPFGGGRQLPEKLKTAEAREKYAANFARKCGMEMCLMVNRRIKVWFSSDGSFKEVVEEVPGGE